MSLDNSQLLAFQSFYNGRSTFITGPGGSGKTFLIKAICNFCKSKEIPYALTATTGIAASNIGGSTIHSWSGIGTGEAKVDQLLFKIKKLFNIKKAWMCTKLLIIDEISMLSGDLLDKLNIIAKEVRGDSPKFAWKKSLPFGGIQVIFTGDFCQLPPVGGTYAFNSAAWAEINPEVIHLTTQHRQIASDEINLSFTNILNGMRFGFLSTDGCQLLRSREIPESTRDDGIKPTILYPLRADVDTINSRELNALPGDIRKYDAYDYYYPTAADEAGDRKKPIPEQIKFLATYRTLAVLDLKPGAQIMLAINLNPKEGLVNGTRGIILAMFEKYVSVKWSVGPTSFDNLHFCVERLEIGEKIFCRSQIPLIHAWALTVHKIQGSTLDYVICDLRRAFEYGQVYVALSRVKHLNGLTLLGFNPDKLKCHPSVYDFYQSHNTPGMPARAPTPAQAAMLDIASISIDIGNMLLPPGGEH